MEPDYDDQIDLMINCSQSKKDQTSKKTDLEQPSEMTEMTCYFCFDPAFVWPSLGRADFHSA